MQSHPLHLVAIGKEAYVAGLFWQSLSSAGDLQDDVRSLGASLGFDHCVVNHGAGVVQAGFGNTADGARRGLVSLAASVAESVALGGALYEGQRQAAPNWLGAFQLGGGVWWYVAVRDFSILPTGDMAGTREDVLARLQADYEAGGWNAVLGDESLAELDLRNFEPRHLTELVRPGSRAARRGQRMQALERAKLPRWAVPLAAGAIAVAVLSVGAWMLRDRFMPRPAPRVAVAPPAPPVPPPAPHPWKDMPLPAAQVQACVAGFGHLAPGGWPLAEYACDGMATWKWRRDGATVAQLLAQMPRAQADLGGSEATLSQPLDTGAARSDEPLLPRRDVLTAFTSGVQALDLAAQIQAQPGSAAGAGTSASATAAPDWVIYTFTLNLGTHTPQSVLPLLDRPGIRVRKISWKDTGDWTLEGIIHAK